MEGTGSMLRIPMLSRENYDTWKLRIQAVMIKNKTWNYVSGEKPRPEMIQDSKDQAVALEIWKEEDEKAKADLYLAINDAELKQVKNCKTAREIWLKLESIFESRGPARKVSLWKKLIGHRLDENGNVQNHVDEFFNLVNKLTELTVDVSEELQTIMLLHSLPDSFENFRCAIQSRDNLPDPESLKVKILDEDTSRRQRFQNENHDAMLARRIWKKPERKGFRSFETNKTEENFKYKCHKCHKVGHKASKCPEKRQKASIAEDFEDDSEILLFVAEETSYQAEVKQRDGWCLDSGCTSHLCYDEKQFHEISTSGNIKLNLANNATTEVKGKGAVRIVGTNGNKNNHIKLENALYIPDLRNNLLSVSKITDAGNSVTFFKEYAIVKDSHEVTILIADRIGDLYFLREGKEEKVYSVMKKESQSKMITWHERFGHLNRDDLIEMDRKEAVLDFNLGNNRDTLTCEICSKAKLTALPFGNRTQRSSKPLEIIYTDVCGPMRTESKRKSRYFVTFTDDYSRWTEVRFIREKHEVFQAFKDFKSLAEKQTGEKIKSLQSDNGKEFCNKNFDEFLRNEGIIRRLTTPYTPQQNGIAERKNRTLVEMARCMLIQSEFPRSFWAEAVSTANYIRNRCITGVLNGKTPFELWHGKRPSVSHLRIFGEVAYALNKDPQKGKFDTRGIKCKFIGYDGSSKGYRLWAEDKQKVIITRDVKFLDNFLSKEKSGNTLKTLENQSNGEKNDILPELVEIQIDPYIQLSENEENTIEINQEGEDENQENDYVSKRGPGRPRIIRNGRPGRPKLQYSNVKHRNTESETKEKEIRAEINVDNTSEHTNYTENDDSEMNMVSLAEISWKEALHGPNQEEWKNAVIVEIECLLKNDTWRIVDRPKDRNVIGCRTILRNKYDAKGNIERRKARVVAKGFTQKPGIDYHDTFAPVARLNSIRLLFALAIKYDLKVHQMDITTAYLNGTIEEEIYMEKPEFFTEFLKEIVKRRGENDSTGNRARNMIKQLERGDKVCKLQKALYGLKQAGQRWNKKLDETLRKLKFTPTNADPCVYYTKRGGETLLALIYVDDILVAYHNPENLNFVRENLTKNFEVKDLGEAHYCLGMEINRRKDYITISQSSYIKDILQRFRMEDSKPVSTPVQLGVKLEKNSNERNEDMEKKPYRELVGALNYLAVATRPDISYIISYLSQFNNCYGIQHWQAAKRVLRYLKGTMDYGITYERNTDALKGFVDADWASCIVDRRSYTGFVFTLSNGPISWESRKQRTVALSSTEAEYMGLTEATKEALYLRKLLSEIGFKDAEKLEIWNDNQGAQLLANNPVFHAKTKHIDVKQHFVRDVLKEGFLELKYLPTEKMPADLLTKGLPKEKHNSFMLSLGIKSINMEEDSNSIEGECLE